MTSGERYREPAAATVDTEDGKTHLRQGTSSACFWSGPVFSEGIMASGHGYRTNSFMHRTARPAPCGGQGLCGCARAWELRRLGPQAAFLLQPRPDLIDPPLARVQRGLAGVHRGLAKDQVVGWATAEPRTNSLSSFA